MEHTIKIRSLTTFEEFQQTVGIQQRTWGPGFDDLVAPILLKIHQKVGAIVAAAYTSAEELVGLVYGFPGYYHGKAIHWSHLLAVAPEYRDRGIGYRLKVFQKESALAMGLDEMMWSYEPLESRNAHFNIERLGVTIDAYEQDLYGAGSSIPRFSGIGTDRFIVRWDLTSERSDPAGRKARLGEVISRRETVDAFAVDVATTTPPFPGHVVVAVPDNIQDLKEKNPDEAVLWRQKTRSAFEFLLANGYQTEGFLHDRDRHKGVYVFGSRESRVEGRGSRI